MLIVSKLHVGDVVDPFIGSVSAVDPKVCFDDLIHPFGFSIGLWVVDCAHGRFEVAESGQFLEDLGGKLRTTVRDKVEWCAKLSKNAFMVESCRFHGIDGLCAGRKNYPFRSVMVCHDHKSVKGPAPPIGRWWEVRDEVDCDHFERPGAFLCWYGHERRDSWVGVDLRLLAHGTSKDIVSNKRSHARPPIVPSYKF